MNCHDFDAIAGDLARDGLMDAGQRESALAHAASCAVCRSRLADERALTGGLRFVAKTSNEEAPARIEEALLAAFRQQREAEPVFVAPMRTARSRWIYVAASVAAVALIVTLLALITSRTKDARSAAPLSAGKSIPSVPDAPPAAPKPEVSPHRMVSALAANTERPPRRRSDRRNVGRSNPSGESPNAPAVDAEIATEFIPLMNREALAQMDGGQVMRVELPRSALMSFGLPMDMERATERIKADVVVGNDGLARAIRFVR